MASSYKKEDASACDAGDNAAGARSSHTGGSGGGRRMSKAERRKAKRRSERAGDTEDEEQRSASAPSPASSATNAAAPRNEPGLPADSIGNLAGADGARPGSDVSSAESQTHTPTAVEASGATHNAKVPTEAPLPEVCAGVGGVEDVDSEDEVAGPAPLRESDIDWSSAPSAGDGAPRKPTMVFEISKGQVPAHPLTEAVTG